MKRPGRATESALTTLAVIVGVGVLLSVLTVTPAATAPQLAAGAPPPGTTSSSGPGTPVAGQPATAPNGKHGGTPTVPGSSGGTGVVKPGQPVVPPAAPGLACAAGHNGGATDVGVSATSVHFAATTVTDGPGASFLAPMTDAMNAVTRQVNSAGGICGRQLDITMRNDSWSGPLGQQYIENFVQGSGVFGFAVNPDSEGLYKADAYIRQQGVPFVGTAGMLIHEYRNPWIWPVGTSTISQMHIIAKDAFDHGARRFSIVFDAAYHFGIEGAYAFNRTVKRLTGQDIPGYDSSLSKCSKRFCGIQPGQSSYTSTSASFNNDCFTQTYQGGACDLIVLLLEPDLALNWLSNPPPALPKFGYAGAQPLFDRQAFADHCGVACDGMRVWTGFLPPEGSYAGLPAEAAYINRIHSYNSTADVDNQFLESSYLGMNLLVQALQQVGPDLTRARLKAVLDSTTVKTNLSEPLVWRPGGHFANTSAIGWTLKYGSNGNFLGFSAATGFERDPWVGQDIPPGE